PDKDGLMNSLEFFLRIEPFNNDSDSDGMLDGIEYYMGLNPSFNDALLDLDDDGIANFYEYQMGLNPQLNDASKDLDKDGLTNLQEFHYGSWANQTDSDQDGMPDKWEYSFRFNATDPTDAIKDTDNDGISNLEEFKKGTNPRNFWSVPLTTLSVAHLVFTFLVLLFSTFIGTTYITYRTYQRRQVIAQFQAPDYPTALKVQKAGEENYTAYLQEEDKATVLYESTKELYLQGNRLAAIYQYEQALKIFERLSNNLMIAETVFRISYILKEQQILTKESTILHHFLTQPFEDKRIEAIDHMLKALIAEIEMNWGAAEQSWKKAMTIGKLSLDNLLLCQKALVDSEYRKWFNNPTEKTLNQLLVKIDEWKNTCEINQFNDHLCNVYILYAQVALIRSQFDEVEKWLEQGYKTAREAGLRLYQETIQKQKEVFLEQKQRILPILEAERLHTPEEQEKRLQEYIRAALLSIERAGFSEEIALPLVGLKNLEFSASWGSFTDNGFIVQDKGKQSPFENQLLQSMIEYSAVLYQHGEILNLYGPFPQITTDKSETIEWNFLSFGFRVKDESIKDPRIVRLGGMVIAILLLFYPKEWDSVVNIRKNEIENYLKSEIESISSIKDLSADILARIEKQLLEIVSFKASTEKGPIS
ncbi:MAG: thrombospondin type 3 repeat-containing protein, partial [Promethearchaeota archaeon]